MAWCSKCGLGDETRLYGLVDGVSYCSDCWKRAGRPWPRRPADPTAVAQTEIRNRGRTLDRRAPQAYHLTGRRP